VTKVSNTNLLAVSFNNQEQLQHYDWANLVKAEGYRSFAQTAETGETMKGRGFAAFTIHRQLLRMLPSPLSSANWRRKHFPALTGLWSKERGDRLAIRAVQYATANAVLVTCGKLIKQEAETQGAKSLAAYVWANQAWLAFKPVIEQREKEPERIWPKIARARPLSSARMDADLRSGQWQGWTVHFAPWCKDFKVRDITAGMPEDTPKKLEDAVKAASYALDFLANYAPFSFIYSMQHYMDFLPMPSLTLLHEMAGKYGPASSRAAYVNAQQAHKVLVIGKAAKGCGAIVKEMQLKFQRLNRAERFRQIREEKRELWRLRAPYRDKERLEALKEETAKLLKCKLSEIPLTEAQELEIKEILESTQKVVDSL